MHGNILRDKIVLRSLSFIIFVGKDPFTKYPSQSKKQRLFMAGVEFDYICKFIKYLMSNAMTEQCAARLQVSV